MAWFPRACYLRMRGEVVALVAESVYPGPIYLTVEEPLSRLPEGAPVLVAGAVLRVGSLRIELGTADEWEPELPAAEAVAAAAPLVAAAATPVAARSALLAPAYAERLALVDRALDAMDLRACEAAIGGLGPGLTPSGDDALSALLFFLRISGRADPVALEAVAREVRTTAVAAAFLRWAARGEVLSPGHDLVNAAARGDAAAAVAAAASLGRVGETSGADFCLGLVRAAELVAISDASGRGGQATRLRRISG